jgi:prepilin-type N-terminal cleavage/methylation domain-containing protein
MRPTLRPSRRGFTLIELAIVVLIIGVILSFILVTGYEGAEQARVRATQALITKLEVALNDRIDALMAVTVKPNGTHQFLASIPVTTVYSPWGLTAGGRAEVIARLDQIKREMPDVFYIQTPSPGNNDYVVNFAGLPFPAPSNGFGTPQSPFAYILPLGNRSGPGFTPSPNPPPPAGYTATDLDPDGDGNPNIGPGAFVGVAAGSFGDPTAVPQTAFGGVPDDGIYGASYSARAALQKLMGATVWGSDTADNDGDGFVDEYDECVSDTNGASATAAAAISTFIANHSHETARAEMLYALLVEGSGPLGNVFSAGDFKDTEVQDTDGDGVPEFVDGWGKPLQFYRWPIWHPAVDLQLGSGPYTAVTQVRETFPLDPGKQLVAPAWFGNNAGSPGTVSLNAQIVHSYFVSAIDPNWTSSPGGVPPYGSFWDITGAYARRSFACKFLVLSAGPDRQFGVYQIDNGAILAAAQNGTPDTIAAQIIGNPGTGGGLPPAFGEDWAAYSNGYPMSGSGDSPPPEALDNISNLDLQSESGGIR